MHIHGGPDHIYSVRKGLPKKWDQRIAGIHWVKRRETIPYRENSMYEHFLNMFIFHHIHPTSLAQQTKIILMLWVFAFSVLFTWKGLPYDLCRLTTFWFKSQLQESPLREGLPCPSNEEEPVSYPLLYQLQLIFSIAINGYHYLIFVLFIFVSAFCMSFPTLPLSRMQAPLEAETSPDFFLTDTTPESQNKNVLQVEVAWENTGGTERILVCLKWIKSGRRSESDCRWKLD